MNTHCSACGTPLPAGSLSCPGCSLPLTAHSVPTVKRRPSLWPFLAMAAALALAIMIFGAGLHQHAEASLAAELHAGALTPELFQARCGQADQVEGGVLRYGHTLVQIHPGAPATYATLHSYTRNGAAASIQIPIEEDVALAEVSCKGVR